MFYCTEKHYIELYGLQIQRNLNWNRWNNDIKPYYVDIQTFTDPSKTKYPDNGKIDIHFKSYAM